MAPPNSSSFSVNVVLPASGWEMMANVRRRLISSASLASDTRPATPQSQFEHGRILASADGLVVAAPHANLLEAVGQIKTQGCGIRGAHLEEGLAHPGCRA